MADGGTWRAEGADFTGEEAGVASFVAAGVDEAPFAVGVEGHEATGAQVGREHRRRRGRRLRRRRRRRRSAVAAVAARLHRSKLG